MFSALTFSRKGRRSPEEGYAKEGQKSIKRKYLHVFKKEDINDVKKEDSFGSWRGGKKSWRPGNQVGIILGGQKIRRT